MLNAFRRTSVRFQSVVNYNRLHGSRATFHKVVSVLQRRATVIPAPTLVHTVSETDALLRSRFIQSARMPVLTVGNSGSRVNVVTTERIDVGTVFGGAATSLVLGAMLAMQSRSSLRIISRSDPANPAAFRDLLATLGITFDRHVDFVWLPSHSGKALPVHEQDKFVSTSWWTTRSLSAITPNNIVYLVQEDERLFYPSSDDFVLCGQQLARQDVQYVVNTELLLRHFQSSGVMQGETALSFEPAFPSSIFHPRTPRSGGRTLLFYARPNHPRNAFYLGLEALTLALRSGSIGPEWRVVLCGTGIPTLNFGTEHKVEIVQDLSWSRYADLLRDVDVGLSLMLSPHPSYPPLDLAACGAQVVTTQFGMKKDLSAYSPSIKCTEPTPEALADALSDAVQAVAQGTYKLGTLNDCIPRDWHSALMPTVDRIVKSW